MINLDQLRDKIAKTERAAAIASLAAEDAKKKREQALTALKEEFGLSSAEEAMTLAESEKALLDEEIQKLSDYLDGANV